MVPQNTVYEIQIYQNNGLLKNNKFVESARFWWQKFQYCQNMTKAYSMDFDILKSLNYSKVQAF